MAITLPLNPPTSQLPPIAKIKSVSLQDIIDAIGYLRHLYNPEVRGTCRIDQKVVFNASRTASESTQAFSEARDPAAKESLKPPSDSSLDVLRADEFERSYAIRWLTSLVARADMLAARDDRNDNLEDSLRTNSQEPSWENTVQEVAALLAVCAGTAAAGLVSRAFAFRHKTGREVKVQVTDVPLENQDYSSVGAQTWGSACLLSEMIVDSPTTFGLDYSVFARGPVRVLELGAGTGLVSLTVGGILKGYWDGGSNDSCGTVVATDFHPSVLQNLTTNAAFNLATWPEHCPVSVSAHHLDWSNLPSTPFPPFDQPFDIIFGADIVYEIEHASWIRSTVEHFLRKPETTSDMPQFHLMIPIRPTHATESQAVEKVFPFAPDPEVQTSSSSPAGLCIVRKEVILCEVHSSMRLRSTHGDLVEYVLYAIACM